jgi:hypothetical protein
VDPIFFEEKKRDSQVDERKSAYYILKLKTSYKYKINNRLKFIIWYQLLSQVHIYLYIVITNRKNILHQFKKKKLQKFFYKQNCSFTCNYI